MSLRSRVSVRAGFAGLAVAGLVGGHCFAARFLTSDPHAHHHATHSHTPYLVALVAGLVVALLGTVIEGRLRTARRGLVTTAVALAGLQLLGFVGLSVMDRITASTGTEIGSRAFWFGIAIQLVVAAVGAVVLATLRRTVDAIGRLLGGERPVPVIRPISETHPSFDVALPSLAMAAGGPTFRGPPQSIS